MSTGAAVEGLSPLSITQTHTPVNPPDLFVTLTEAARTLSVHGHYTYADLYNRFFCRIEKNRPHRPDGSLIGICFIKLRRRRPIAVIRADDVPALAAHLGLTLSAPRPPVADQPGEADGPGNPPPDARQPSASPTTSDHSAGPPSTSQGPTCAGQPAPRTSPGGAAAIPGLHASQPASAPPPNPPGGHP